MTNEAQAKRRYTSSEKLKMLKLHLLDKRPVSEICKEYNVTPANFYRWQQQLFENGESAFEREGPRNAEIERLEATLSKRESALVDLMQEHLELKKRALAGSRNWTVGSARYS